MLAHLCALVVRRVACDDQRQTLWNQKCWCWVLGYWLNMSGLQINLTGDSDESGNAKRQLKEQTGSLESSCFWACWRLPLFGTRREQLLAVLLDYILD